MKSFSFKQKHRKRENAFRIEKEKSEKIKQKVQTKRVNEIILRFLIIHSKPIGLELRFIKKLRCAKKPGRFIS